MVEVFLLIVWISNGYVVTVPNIVTAKECGDLARHITVADQLPIEDTLYQCIPYMANKFHHFKPSQEIK